MVCPICNSKINYSADVIKNKEKPACEHYFFRNASIAFGEGYSEEVAKHRSEEIDVDFREDFEYKLANYIERQLAKYNNNSDKKTFLSLGCGMGFDVMEFLRRNYNSFGIETADISHEWFEYHDTHANRLIVSPEGSIPFEDNSFDLILSYVVLEHVGTIPPKEIVTPNTQQIRFHYIKNGVKKLKRGGIMILIAPNKFTPIDPHHGHHYIPFSNSIREIIGYTPTIPFIKSNFLPSVIELENMLEKINQEIKIYYEFLSDRNDLFFGINYKNYLVGKTYSMLYQIVQLNLKKYFTHFIYLLIKKSDK